MAATAVRQDVELSLCYYTTISRYLVRRGIVALSARWKDLLAFLA